IFVLFNDTATTEICPLSLHDALPISFVSVEDLKQRVPQIQKSELTALAEVRSEEHTSELQSHTDLVCHLLLEKKATTSSGSTTSLSSSLTSCTSGRYYRS